MQIQYRDIDTACDLADVYNKQIVEAGVPFCYPVSAVEFVMGLKRTNHEDAPIEQWGLHSMKIIVGMEADKVVGFSHIAVKASTLEGEGRSQGLIRLFTYPSRDRAAGRAILEASEKYLSEREVTEIIAFPAVAPVRFFHAGGGTLPSVMTHVYSLLGVNGYVLRKYRRQGVGRQVAQILPIGVQPLPNGACFKFPRK